MTVEPTLPPREKPARPAAVAALPKSTVPQVIVAMNEVAGEIAKLGLAKAQENKQQGFKFRGIDDVLNLLATIIAEHKLVIIPHVRSRDLIERQTKSGGALFSVTVSVEYTFVSAIDGSREPVGPFDGEAMDSADKATNKAMSAAYKYMAIQTFCIPTEGDNDADATTHEVVAIGGKSADITDEQLAALQAKIDATGTDIALFCEYMRVDALRNLTQKGYTAAMAALDAKAKAQAKGGAK